MGRTTGSWLSGPQAGLDNTDVGAYRGETLGLPESGPGSLVSSWQRVLGLFVDWVMCYGVSLLFVGFLSPSLSTVVLAVWFVVGVVTVTLFSFTPGQFIVGMRVARVDGGGSVGIVRAVARQILIVFIVPPLVNDAIGRGMHDRATGTALVRAR
ncbi:RDD family protein [Williamsia herbipolensis]|uniref:RDD family protein n=1 Tax=Williamsia herbipolensis TaxID=1603258 RepID=A0AAU4K547_9NOCA|nr:RDD family protein [Williamsia herbipolensis]MCX6470607.1 RDD family protein [Mycobacteriales bacterium]